MVLECNGVGYLCRVSLQTQKQMPKQGAAATLYTHLSVREDAVELFGFATKAERSCFQLLTAISGVGPKAGLAVLSVLTPEQVATAAATGDSRAFTAASGVGKKLAERIVLEIKDKVKAMQAGTGAAAAAPAGVRSAAGNAQAAVDALAVLGYSEREAAAVVAKLDSSLAVETLIREALKSFGSAR